MTKLLSPLEKSCLRWLSQGRTIAEIALLEGKSVRAIELRVTEALSSLGMSSIGEAHENARSSEPD